jgi:hypothetical protein
VLDARDVVFRGVVIYSAVSKTGIGDELSFMRAALDILSAPSFVKEICERCGDVKT